MFHFNNFYYEDRKMKSFPFSHLGQVEEVARFQASPHQPMSKERLSKGSRQCRHRRLGRQGELTFLLRNSTYFLWAGNIIAHKVCH